MLPKRVKLIKDKDTIREILLPMVPAFCETIKKKAMVDEVTMMLLNTDTVDSFALINGKQAVGFAAYTTKDLPSGERHLHLWYAYVRKKDRAKLSHKWYETTKALMDGLEISRFSYTGVDERKSARFAERFKKYDINLKLFGYHYQTIGE